MVKQRRTCYLILSLVVILFPVILGAAELPVYEKYQGPIEPGVIVSKANWDNYLPELKKLLPPGKLQWYGMGVKKGLVTMPIVQTTYKSANTNGQLEATRKYAGTARVGADNQLHDWVAGIPFPEPKNGLEIAWNAYPTVSRNNSHDDLRFTMWFGLFQGAEYEKQLTWDYYSRKYRGRTTISPLGDMPLYKETDLVFREATLVTSPNEVKGFILVRSRYWDINKPDDCYAYIPAIRRLRRMTGSDLTDPLLGADLIPDDYGGWWQKFNPKMKIRALACRDMLVPRTYVGLESKPPYDPKKNGPCFQVEWEIRPQWEVEIMINDPDYVYSKRILYIDALPVAQGGNFLLYWGENYDQKGRLWRAAGLNCPVVSKEGFQNSFFWVFMTCLTNHYTAFAGDAAYLKNLAEDYPLSEKDVFTIKGLLKKAH